MDTDVYFAASLQDNLLPQKISYMPMILLPNSRSNNGLHPDYRRKDDFLLGESLDEDWGWLNHQQTHRRRNTNSVVFSTPEEAVAYAKQEFNKIFGSL